MGSKSNPGKFDCHAKAEPDEPMFVLLGRDPVASSVVNYWVALREELGKTEPEVLAEAVVCAVKLRRWALFKGKGDQVTETLGFVRAVLERQTLRGEVDRLSERVRELEKERDEDRDRYETTVGHVRTLEVLCRRAADFLESQELLLDVALQSDGPTCVQELVKELREADPRARIEEGSRLLRLETLCRRVADELEKIASIPSLSQTFSKKLQLRILAEELRAV